MARNGENGEKVGPVTGTDVKALADAVNHNTSAVRRHRIALYLAIPALVLAIVLGVVGYVVVQRQNEQREDDRVEQAAKLEAERQERILSTCLRDNETTTRRREADFAQQKFLMETAVARGSTTPAAGAAYLEGQRKVIEAKWPYRDCSKKGIVAWYKNPPAPVSCSHPDGGGLCLDEPTPTTTTTTTTAPLRLS